jgi:hypothetical protein
LPGLMDRSPRSLATTFSPSDLVLRATSRGPKLPAVAPFVGLWGLPSLPACTASWPSRPYNQVRPVDLTAFPGGPTSGLRSCRSGCSERAKDTSGPSRRQVAKRPVGEEFPQVSMPRKFLVTPGNIPIRPFRTRAAGRATEPARRTPTRAGPRWPPTGRGGPETTRRRPAKPRAPDP